MAKSKKQSSVKAKAKIAHIIPPVRDGAWTAVMPDGQRYGGFKNEADARKGVTKRFPGADIRKGEPAKQKPPAPEGLKKSKPPTLFPYPSEYVVQFRKAFKIPLTLYWKLDTGFDILKFEQEQLSKVKGGNLATKIEKKFGEEARQLIVKLVTVKPKSPSPEKPAPAPVKAPVPAPKAPQPVGGLDMPKSLSDLEALAIAKPAYAKLLQKLVVKLGGTYKPKKNRAACAWLKEWAGKNPKKILRMRDTLKQLAAAAKPEEPAKPAIPDPIETTQDVLPPRKLWRKQVMVIDVVLEDEKKPTADELAIAKRIGQIGRVLKIRKYKESIKVEFKDGKRLVMLPDEVGLVDEKGKLIGEVKAKPAAPKVVGFPISPLGREGRAAAASGTRFAVRFRLKDKVNWRYVGADTEKEAIKFVAFAHKDMGKVILVRQVSGVPHFVNLVKKHGRPTDYVLTDLAGKEYKTVSLM